MRQNRSWFARSRRFTAGGLAALLLAALTLPAASPTEAQVWSSCEYLAYRSPTYAATYDVGWCDEIGVSARFFDPMVGGFVWTGMRRSTSDEVRIYAWNIVNSRHAGYRWS